MTIKDAIAALEQLNSALENAFWDASDIPLKDQLFALITAVHAEANELAKLSISDLEMPYENITPEFSHCCRSLRELMRDLHVRFPRTQTANQLNDALPAAAKLLKNCEL